MFAKKFKELAEKYTNGAVEVKLRCCGQIGTEDDAFKAMQLGTVDSYFISQNNVSPHWPLMDVFVLPYIFQSEAHVTKVATGPVGETIRKQLPCRHRRASAELRRAELPRLLQLAAADQRGRRT